ncbi:transketolase C-terminal domain-containing protein [Petroclostridium sp. X23]|uniref:transketolase family protein n=1 Tax=Petroclostridium sp. X23 TaxID=3045146 RepID=UPI0024ADBD3A|nr:transketolase C-terminal domain-containing protein [Petroclostridium sp. X23]WHH59078.1 transketolase C-terminal domain-containing protein [Petroclostridium sp. X23]
MANKKAIRDAYGEVLLEIGKENKDVVVLDADVASSSKSGVFGKEFPDRFFNVGIAEANMAAIAAGLATTGKIPFINTFAAFMVLRAADPARSLIAYTNLNVKLAGTYAGLSDSYDGASHHAIADIAFMRALPNMTVISVADAVETAKATKAAAAYNGPVYLRLSRAEVPIIFDESYEFEIGKGVQLTEGNDVTIVATGYMVTKSLEAAELLKSKGIKARVVNIHTIKPIDKELLIKCAQETGAVVTAEEHNVYGGLGSAVSEVLIKEYPVPMEIIGVEDTFTESGDYEELLEKYGLSAGNIVSKVEAVMKKKK